MYSKESLRKAMLDARSSLSSSMRSMLSNMIQYRVLTLDEFNGAKIVGAYYPINSEVDTRMIMLHAINNKILALPKVIGNDMIFVKVNDLDNLVRGRYRIMEPRDDNEVKPDILLIPAVAYSKDGYRIGYGKGYYDRYLANNDCYSIGLAYDFQVFNSIPHDENDMKVKMIITDKRIIHC